MATRAAFIEKVIEEITEGRSMPTAPKKSRIGSIINSALDYFWENDDDVHEFEYIIISSMAFETPLFSAKRQIKLPECVHAVTDLQEIGHQGGYQYGEVDSDYRQTNFNFHLALSGDSDAMLYGVVASWYADFMRNFVVRTVAYEYHEHSNALTIKGRDVRNHNKNDISSSNTTGSDLVASCYVHMCEENVFESNRFFRYVCGKCRISFSRIFSLTDAKLIGGLMLNMSEMKSDGKEEVDEVKEEIEKQKDTIDFFGEF